MKPAPFAYVRPDDGGGSARGARRRQCRGRAFAGGQSLVPMLALRLARPELLVDLNRIPGLSGIREEATRSASAP